MNTEHVVVDNKGEIVFRCDTYEQAALWLHNPLDGKRYTIELMDKPSEPKTTPEQAAAAFIDAARDLSERRRLADKTSLNAEPVEPRQAHEIAEAALQHVKDRASTYDQSNGERSAGKTATAFNAITGKDLTESDVWLLLQLLKDVRQWSKEDYHQDSAEDCIAYAALKAESLEREHKHKP